ncbi:MAG: hypothetical protein ACTHMS_24015 [Jatrophihabitans sp.]|uniref:hypothetical protein n=1 Tax=Jatrophihabitans sp. TaxID=1932789 RepID=UPI003F8215FD
MSDFGPPEPPRHPSPGPSPYAGPPSWGPPPAGPASSTATGWADPAGGTPTPPGSRFGERLQRRPEPRFAVALAGAGAVLALIGLVVWAGQYVGSDLVGSVRLDENGLPTGRGGSDRHILAGVIFLAVAAVGVLLGLSRRRGPLATAATALFAGGVPLALGFFSLDVSGGSFPLNLDLIAWVSIVAWAVAYAAVPGLRGHTVLIFLIATTFFDYVLFKSAQDEVLGRVASSAFNTGDVSSSGGAGAITAVGLIFGLGYYAIAFALDRRGLHGPATGLVYPAFGATVLGLVGFGIQTSITGAGVLTVLLGIACCLAGARNGRRATSFVWAAGVVVGVGLVVEQQVDGTSGRGVTFAVVGAVLVALAQLVASATREPDDMDPAVMVRSR